MDYYDVVFRVSGPCIYIDHLYWLYSALSQSIPDLHTETSPIRFGPIEGMAVSDGRLRLDRESLLRIRAPEDWLFRIHALAGESFRLGDATIKLSTPRIFPLTPASSLFSRLVTFKNADNPERFLQMAQYRLNQMNITCKLTIPHHLDGERAGQPKRRVIRIKGATVPGYPLMLWELSPGSSLKIQVLGLGGRTRFGCGFFQPMTLNPSMLFASPHRTLVNPSEDFD